MTMNFSPVSDVTFPRQHSAAQPPAKPPSSVRLRQSPLWSRAILWGLLASTAFAFIWASVAQIEEAIPTTGKLEPQGAVKEVQSPVNGVVKTVHVKDGQTVKKGDLLLTIDPTAVKAQLQSLQKVRAALIQEAQFYRSQSRGKASITQSNPISPEIASLAKSRAALAAEMRLYQAELTDLVLSNSLSQDERSYLQYSQAEILSRTAAIELETQQLGRQLAQTQIQLLNAQDSLAVNQKILDDIEPLAREGGISRVQFLRQRQEARKSQAEVAQLAQEQQRIQFAISQGRERRNNAIALHKKEILTRMADNSKKIAEIDSQLNKLVVENEKRIAEIDSQISQANLTLRYQELRAPADGTVFDLQARSSGFVTTPSQPILKIVPNEQLTAQVFITNKDIGFIKPGMEVDVRIDSFPFSEFGDVKGEVVWIGSDALPPNQIRPFYSFPAKIRLKQSTLKATNQPIRLQSGMSISANIKLRKRTVMSILTDQFSQKVDSLKSIR